MSPNNITHYKTLVEWFDIVTKSQEVSQPICTHVSDFLQEGVVGEELVQSSIKLLSELVIMSIEKNIASEYMPMLVIPMGFSEKIEFWDDLLLTEYEQVDEPPSIYLFKRIYSMYLDSSEEYIVPVTIHSPEFHGNKHNYKVYYRCFRDPDAIINDWEYSKALYFEYYHNDFLF